MVLRSVQDDMWSAQVRTFGHDAFEMQPLKLGTRVALDKNTPSKSRKQKMTEIKDAKAMKEKKKVVKSRKAKKDRQVMAFLKIVRKANGDFVEVDSFDEIAISDGLSAEERAVAVWKATTASKAQKIGMALSSLFNNLNLAGSTIANMIANQSGSLSNKTDKDDLADDERDFPPDVEYACPRWNEITEYLFKNRGPWQLALDTMGILSVPSFYRYIRDRGGISLKPLEFWNFLGAANKRQELFMYAFPAFLSPSSYSQPLTR